MPINDSNRTDDNDNTVVSVGESQTTDIAELGTSPSGAKALNVIASIEDDIEDAKPGPCLSSKYRVEVNDTNLSMPSSFVTLYTYSGTGRFHGFVYDFNDDDVEIRLTIDGEQIFSFDMDILDGMNYGVMMCRTMGFNVVAAGENETSSRDILEFCPQDPICFNSSVLIQGRKLESGTKRVTTRITFITKAT